MNYACCDLCRRQDSALYAHQMFSVGKVTSKDFSWILRQLFYNPDA